MAFGIVVGDTLAVAVTVVVGDALTVGAMVAVAADGQATTLTSST